MGKTLRDILGNDAFQQMKADRAKRLAEELERKPRDIMPFLPWCAQETSHFTWNWSWQLMIEKRLNKITNGEIDKLMLFLPPRSGKSETVTIRYAAWRIIRQPTTRVIIGAYNQSLARKFSRKIREIVKAEGIDLATDNVDDWETLAGGGVRAVGRGAGVTGTGADLIIIDDPIKGMQEANSQGTRDSAYEWITVDLDTRLQPGAAMIIIQTRWHVDDPGGRLLSNADWDYLSIPAIAETQEERDYYAERVGLPKGLPDPLGRQPGEAMPGIFTIQRFLKFQKASPRMFQALYQQQPTEFEGNYFKRSMFEGKLILRSALPENRRMCRYWDKAGTQDGGSYTAGAKVSIDKENRVYIEHIARGQWSMHEREKEMRRLAEEDGIKVPIYIEQEPGSGGKDSVTISISNLLGFTARADKVTGSKETRWNPFHAQCEAGNVFIVIDSGWNYKAFLNELYELTPDGGGKYKDQADAVCGAFSKLAIIGETKLAWIER